MKKKFKTIALALSLIMVFVVLAACAPADDAAPEATPAPANGGGGGETAATPAPGADVTDADDVQVEVAWWGGEARHELFNRIWDSYEEQNQHVTVIRQFAPWGDYWTRIFTQAAGGGLPDVFGTGPAYRGDLASRGFLMPLDPFVADGTLEVAGIVEGSLAQGVYPHTGNLYIITFGDTVSVIAFNQTLIESVGMPLPRNGMTYSEFIEYALELQELLPDGVWASNGNPWEHQFLNHARQFGGLIVDEVNGVRQIGFRPQDLQGYYEFYMTKLELGLSPPAEVTAENIGRMWVDSLEGTGRLAMWHTNANQLKIFQSQTDDTISAFRSLIADGAYYQYVEEIQPSGWAIAATSSVGHEAARLVNWFTNNIDTQVTFNMELGVPGSAEAQNAIIGNLTNDPIDLTIGIEIDLVNLIADTAIPMPWRLEGSPAIWTEVVDTWQEIMFGMISIEDAVARVFERGAILLG